ncbi:MAG: hypothetical protein GEU97_13705 [Actinophytocola sp.]|nr:hypothetical protein [Actinophytocola sp.]
MRRGSWSDQHGLLRANSNNDVIRVLRLEALGVPSCTTYRRCGTEGPWQRVLPGIVALHNGPVTRHNAISAALLYAGESALVTGLEACARHGLRAASPDGEVHLLVPAERKVHSAGFVVIERTKHLPRPIVRKQVPLAPLDRAVLDACRRMTRLDPCRALLTEAVQRRFTNCERLHAQLANGSSRGSAVPRKVLAEMSAGAHSVAEVDGKYVWQRAGLPAAQWNGSLYGPDGEFLASPDAWVDDVAFGWEIDSVTHHAGHEGFQRTIARNTRYSTAGVVILQTLPSRLRKEPEAVCAELRAAYEAAAARPRPAVTFRPQRGE